MSETIRLEEENDALIDRVRQLETKIRELTEDNATAEPGIEDSAELRHCLIEFDDPEEEMDNGNIRVEPRCGGNGTFMVLRGKVTGVLAMTDEQSLELAEALQNVVRYQKKQRDIF